MKPGHAIGHRDPRRLAALARCPRLGDAIGAAAHEVAGLGPDLDQAGVLQHQVGLDHGGDADRAVGGELPHRRQPLTGAQRSALDGLAEISRELFVQEIAGRIEHAPECTALTFPTPTQIAELAGATRTPCSGRPATSLNLCRFA
jgi:hypothetical protein